MKSIRALVADDEAPARGRLRTLLSRESDIEIVGEAANGDEAIAQVSELKPDLLFLDVQMPPPDGIGVLRALRDEWLPCTIFTTAFAEHAVAAFELHALDYLLKPFSRARFTAALQRAREHLALRGSKATDERLTALLEDASVPRAPIERILVKTNERYIVVPTSEIVWVESADNYVILHAASGNHILRKTLSALEQELDSRAFFRTSRSTIVKLQAVAEIQQYKVGEHVIILRDKTRVPLTRGLREFQERLQAGV